jgi:hypothetical protein
MIYQKLGCCAGRHPASGNYIVGRVYKSKAGEKKREQFKEEKNFKRKILKKIK